MRLRIVIAVVLVLAVLAGMAGFSAYKLLKPKYLKTETFVNTYMTNGNGTLATYLAETPKVSPDTASGREALSEALGLWLQYSVAKNDRMLFDRHYALLKKYFIAPQGYVYWKISPDGAASVSTNALVDDLRIIDALYSAAQKWDNAEYAATADGIGRITSSYLIKGGLLTDFFDFKYKNSPDSLTLSYLDVKPLSILRQRGILPAPVAEKTLGLLRELPSDGVFFPKTYHIKTGTYTYDASINLIDQLLVALQRNQAGVASPELMAFLKQQFYQNRVIYGNYTRQTREPAAAFESPAVYALVILYSLQAGDRQFAVDVYQRMIQFRQQKGIYAGGYVSRGETHIFDNLYPQLAELTLYKAYPLYFILHQ